MCQAAIAKPLLAAGLLTTQITMTAKEQASSLVEYFWTDVEEFKQYETIRMTKEMAKDCAIKVAEEAKIEIGNFDRTDGFVQTREDFWDAVIVEIRSI